MSQELDELFGEGDSSPEPRAWLVWALLVTGLVTAVLGLACTAAPGGLLVLLAWNVVEKEVDRLESGYFPDAERARVVFLQRVTYGGLIAVILLFVVQVVLLYQGFYEWLWGTSVVMARAWLGG